MVKVGCCGFPKGRRSYFSQFKLVEVQQTFYKPPSLETAMRWREEAGEGFEFCLKAWQLITHHPSSPTYRKAGIVICREKEDGYGGFKPTEEVWEAWRKTEQMAQVLKAKVILFQCPSSFKESPENVENMRRFFREVKRGGFLFAWEPRGGWSDRQVSALCEQLDLIHGVDPLERAPLYGRAKYFRLHGGRGYGHVYSDEELEKLRGMAEGEVYVLFNNRSMYDDALRFIKLVERP
jgi:uncharacterized protein YecE (DUF72 family)